ncbi:hypothetical protein [Lachnospira pectinoschiza]|uniref:Uncharacterized protein n=1 Tax=Lachnospira pectinoschiza TaxID=28052 RepID=A0A1G9TMT9_9FIRM|nr:hypothetical protein [Lachnospira pectinoschiza]SDM49067.1 hypothetical protein SAMN05216544_0419 [Lachnospira pectinoschiza]
MADITNKKAMLLQNLRDAGCDQKMIDTCMNIADQNADAKILPLLQEYRTCQLDRVHREQDKLESLDYLMYQLQKQRLGQI